MTRKRDRARKRLAAQRFEEHRTHLPAAAYRMVGSVSEADDAVQEAWLRMSRADPEHISQLDLAVLDDRC